MKPLPIFGSVMAISLAIATPSAFGHAGHGDEFQATGGVNRVEVRAETDALLGIQVTPIEAAADGAIRILGRRSTDLIKTGGYRVGAGEVEACLLDHPAVREVAVAGLPDDDLGQRISAFVVARDGVAVDADELVAHVVEQLSPHKRPREVHFVAELPRNAMGKVQKKKLAALRE